MTRADFDRDDAWQARLAQGFLDPYYRSLGWTVTRYAGTHPMQRRHVDVTLRARGVPDRHNDEKILRGRHDRNPATKVSFETWSCTLPGLQRPGWGAKDEPNDATHLLIAYADTDDMGPQAWRKVRNLDCLWIPFAPFRDWFWSRGEDAFEARPNEQSNGSISRKVPIRAIMANIAGTRRFGIGLEIIEDEDDRYCPSLSPSWEDE